MTEPRHAALARELRRRIAHGELAQGAPLPSEATLGAEFGVARGTVRQALSTLRVEGVVAGGRGRPPVVRTGPAPQRFETFMSFTRFAVEAGHVPGQRTLEVARRGADEVAASALDLPVGAPVVQVLRLRLLDGCPAMLERSTFVLEVGRHLFAVDTDAGSIYAALTERGADLHAARHVVDAVAADADDARLLEVDTGAALLRETRRVTTAEGVPLEHAQDLYRPDRVTFTIDNSVGARPAVVRRPGPADATSTDPGSTDPTSSDPTSSDPTSTDPVQESP